MSEVMENISEKNSAQSSKATEPPTKTVEDGTTNDVEADVNSVPEAVESTSATKENADDSGSKEVAEKSSTSPKVDDKKTPVKRTPSKRMSFIERAQRESEELVKNMGGSLEIEGGRRTRSSTRGTPTRSVVASTPPPAKKARTSPASGASTPTRPRGRGRKIDVADDAAEEEDIKPTPNKKKTTAKGKKAADKDVAENEEIEETAEEATERNTEEREEKVDSNESHVVANQSKEKTADENVIDESQDKTDAALESVVEETQSQLAAELLSNVTKKPKSTSAPAETVVEAVKNDSPMETEDVNPVESVTDTKEAKPEEATTATIETLQDVKEPTPEPMEVDSSSKSNDALEKMEDEIAEERDVVKKPIKFVENPQSTAKQTPVNFAGLNNATKIEHIKENCIAAPPAGIAANNSIVKSAAVTNVANANENKTEETANAANDLNKTENNLCEPKIATSPPITAANDKNTVTTPQTCN